MKNKLSLCLTFLLCFVIALSFSACGEKDGKTAAITLMNSDTEHKAVWEEVAKKYKEEKGVDLKVVTVDKSRYPDTLKTELKKNEAPTVFELTGIRDFEQVKDYCADLKNETVYSDLFDREIAIKDGADVAAVPYSVTGMGILYNDEIAKKYFALDNKKSELSSMEEVKTLAQLKTVAEDMQAHKKELGIDGAVASLSLASGEEDRYSRQLLGTPIYYEMKEKEGDVRDNLYRTETIEFRYSSRYKDLFDLLANHAVTAKETTVDKKAEDSYREFTAGKAAMMPGDSTLWRRFEEMEGNMLEADDVKMLPLYIGMEGEDRQGLNVAADGYFAVNKKADDDSRRAAIHFLDWLFKEKSGKSYITKLGYNAPFGSIADSERSDDPLMKETVRHIKSGAENVIMALDGIFPDAEYYQKVGTGLRDYATGKESFDTVKRTVTEEWKRPE